MPFSCTNPYDKSMVNPKKGETNEDWHKRKRAHILSIKDSCTQQKIGPWDTKIPCVEKCHTDSTGFEESKVYRENHASNVLRRSFNRNKFNRNLSQRLRDARTIINARNMPTKKEELPRKKQTTRKSASGGGVRKPSKEQTPRKKRTAMKSTNGFHRDGACQYFKSICPQRRTALKQM